MSNINAILLILTCVIWIGGETPEKKRNMLAGLQKVRDAKYSLPAKIKTPPKTTNITKDGKLLEQAEASLLTLSMKYVNFNTYQSSEQMLEMFKNFANMRRGHMMKVNTKVIEEFNSQKDHIKINVCKLYMSDSLLQFNGLQYDDKSESKEILFTKKTVKYRYHIKHHKFEIVLQCPIRFKGKRGYIYFSTTEREYSYNSDLSVNLHLPIFYYVYTEYSYPPSSEISILMRTKLLNGWNSMLFNVQTVKYLTKLWYLLAGKRQFFITDDNN